jgi:hypothetical protein
MKTHTYIEITQDSTDEVVKRLDVTDLNEKKVSVICSGMERNMNHNQYSLGVKEYETEQEEI